MKVIITGGTGLIGSQLSKKLLQDNHDVIILSRNPQKHQLPEGAVGAQWDGKTAVGWQEHVEDADAIVNLAGESIAGSGFPPPRWTDEKKKRILQSRLDAGTAVTDAVIQAKNKPKVVIQASGIDYYGNVPNDSKITEDSPKGEGFLSDVTEKWEASTASVTTMGVHHVIIRTGIVLSMESGALPQTAMPFRFFAGGPMGSGNQWWPWIHEDDEIRAIQFLLEKDSAAGVFNLCAPNPVQNKQFAKALGQAMGRPSLIPAPSFALKTMLGEMSTIVLDGRRALPQKLEDLGFVFRYPNVREALLDLLNQI